ncbi:MAG: response regulator [Candidatus Omnitrophota bacterium]|jgi:two-component system chemotaxis response regulator CheY|nr:MAG: response regulator [Candidatus Omnitrophota bacterium]
MNVLVVDDSGAMRKLIISNLSAIPVSIDFVEAENGDKAIYQLKLKEYDAILMDWNMPGMSGLDAVHHIRALGFNVPIIMVTTNTERLNVIQALKAGANNYVIKPFTKETLIAKFKETISKTIQI